MPATAAGGNASSDSGRGGAARGVPRALVLPVTFACIGFSGGLTKTTMTAMWAEIFGPETLGTIRSAIAMYMVFVSALSPFVFGAALSAGMSVSAVLGTMAAVGVLLAIPPVAAERRGL